MGEGNNEKDKDGAEINGAQRSKLITIKGRS